MCNNAVTAVSKLFVLLLVVTAKNTFFAMCKESIFSRKILYYTLKILSLHILTIVKEMIALF